MEPGEAQAILDAFFAGGRTRQERDELTALNLTVVAAEVRRHWNTVPAKLQKIHVLNWHRRRCAAHCQIARRGLFAGIIVWVNQTQLSSLRHLTIAGGFPTMEDWLLYSIAPAEMEQCLKDGKALQRAA